MEEADDGTDLPLERDGVDSMLRELFPDLDLDMVKRVLGLDLTSDGDDTEEAR